uniref:7TM_GPCR_Srx domain-containing protein n=1 Tax=Globodera pallida TaxID=36090 RepID=A0A183CM33_GLOPA
MQLEIGLEPVGLLMGVFEPEKFTRMYNCNVYNVEDIPLEKRQSITLGIMFLTLGLICLWITESTAEMLLAFNRCVEVSSSYWADVLFHGKRIYLWMIIPTLYGLYSLFFTTPAQFSGLFGSWFANPHVGYIDDFGKIYHNDLHTIHNYIVVVVLTGTYFALAIILTIKTWKLNNSQTGGGFSRSQKSTFLQVILISSVNATAAFLFVYMQFVRISGFLIVLAQLTWILSHGTPPIIYLLFNKTVRHDVYNMLLCLMSKVLCCAKLDAVGINTTMAFQGGPGIVRVAPTQSFRI